MYKKLTSSVRHGAVHAAVLLLVIGGATTHVLCAGERLDDGQDTARPISEQDLKEAAANIRAEHAAGGRLMWDALAALVKPGMTVVQMKTVLPPAHVRAGDAPREVILFDGAWFMISYALDAQFGVEASGIANGKGQEQMVLAAPPRIKPVKDIPRGTAKTKEAAARTELPNWAQAVAGALPGWEVVRCDREASVQVGPRRGYRMVLRKAEPGWGGPGNPVQGVAAPTPGAVRQNGSPEFVTHAELVLVPVAADLPERLAKKTPWQKLPQTWHVQPVDMGEGMGFRWFARTTLYWQEWLREKLKLKGGDGRLALLAEGLFIEDKGSNTANSVMRPLKQAGEKAVPYIEAAIKRHAGDDPWKAIHALGYIQGDRATAVLKSLYASNKERVSQAAAYALIHEPYRKAAREEYFDLLRRQKYVDRAAAACVEFEWREAIPLLQAVCDEPALWGNYRDALKARRTLEGRPIAPAIEDAHAAIVNTAHLPLPTDEQTIAQAKKVLLGSSDTEAVRIAAIGLAIFDTKADKQQVQRVQQAGREILKRLPADDTKKLLRTLVDGMKAHGQDEGYWRECADLLEWLSANNGTTGDGQSWGEAVEGVQVALRAEKLRWQTGETTKFTTQSRKGARQIVFGWGDAICELEFDSRWYYLAIDDHPVDRICLEEPWKDKETHAKLPLSPGKHTIRVAIIGPVDGKSVRAVSNRVEFVIERALPGSTRAIEHEMARSEFAFAAVCEAAGSGTVVQMIDDGGTAPHPVYETVQEYNVREVLAGKTPPEGAVKLQYSHQDAERCRERAVTKGECVIWLVCRFDHIEGKWYGVKAIADIPENRKAIAAAESVQGEAVNGLKCSIGVRENSLRVGDEIRIDAKFENVSDKPILFPYPPDYAARLLLMHDKKGRAVGSRMTGITEGWMDNKPFRTLQPGESSAVTFTGKIAFRPTLPRRAARPEPALSIDFRQDAMLFTLQVPGSFTVALRLASDEEAAARLREQGLGTVWQGAVSSNVARFEVKAATRAELDAAIETLRGEVEGKRRESIRLLGAHMDAKAVPGLMEIALKGPPELRADAAASLGAIGDSSIVPALVAEYRKAGSVQDRQLILGIIEAASDWTQQLPLYLEIARSGGSHEETSLACSRLADLGRPEVVPVLIERAKSGAPMVQRGAIDHDVLKLREMGKADAVPVLEQIVVDNLQSGRIHGFAAAQALFCIGTREAHQVLSKHLLAGQYRAGQAIDYAFHWEMAEPQRSRFIEQYLLKNVSEDLVVELQQRASTDENKGQIAATAAEIRREYPEGGKEMWDALAARVKPGMSVAQMKIVLPPRGVHTMDVTGGGFGIRYKLDENDDGFDAVASGAWGGAKPDDPDDKLILNTPARVKKTQLRMPKLTDVKITIDHKIAWSKPVGGLSGGLVVPRTTITADGFFEVLLTLRNTGTEPVAVQTENCFTVDLDVKNEKGDSVPPTWTRCDILSPPARWVRLAPNASTSFQVCFEHKDGTGEGNLDSITEIWRLEPGKYELCAKFASKGFFEAIGGKRPENVWQGEIVLPPVKVEVLDDRSSEQRQGGAATPGGTGHEAEGTAKRLGVDDLAKRWTPQMHLNYAESDGSGGRKRAVSIDGRGELTLTNCGGLVRIVTALPQQRLDAFAARLREIKIWELCELEPQHAEPDVGEIYVSYQFQFDRPSIAGFWPMPLATKQRVLVALRQEIQPLIDATLTVADTERKAAADLPWGEDVHGVRVRLRADKTTWSTREVPVIKVDAENNGEEEFHLVGFMTLHCYAHIDDVTYLGTAAVPGGSRPKDTFTAVPVKLTGSPHVAGSFQRFPVSTNPDEGRLELKPGENVVRISFRMLPRGAPDGAPHVEVFSNPLQIEIVSGEGDQPAVPPRASDREREIAQLLAPLQRNPWSQWSPGAEVVREFVDDQREGSYVYTQPDLTYGLAQDGKKLVRIQEVDGKPVEQVFDTSDQTGLVPSAFIYRVGKGVPAQLRIDDVDVNCLRFEDTLVEHVAGGVHTTVYREWVLPTYPTIPLRRETNDNWWRVKSLRNTRRIGDRELSCVVVESHMKEAGGHARETQYLSADVPGHLVESVKEIHSKGNDKSLLIHERVAAIRNESKALSSTRPTSEVEVAETDVPKHLQRWGGLYDRVGGKIVDAPAEDVKVAKGYVAFADKGKIHNGRRVTIMTAKQQYAVGEEVRVIHVLEAVEPGSEVLVMGPKTVFGECVDGKDLTKGIPKPHRYDGRVLASPAVDYNYAITKYTFNTPGEYTIQWRAAGPFDGEGLASNVLKIVVAQAGEAGGAPGHPEQSRADTVLPGSRLSIEEAVGRWAAFAVACEAVEEPEDSAFAHVVPGSVGKRHQYRWDVDLGGGRNAGGRRTLDYRVWNIGQQHERPIAKGQRVIWIGVNPTPDHCRGVTALPDTPENRETVRAAFANRPASADKYVAFPERADAEGAAERVALLKRSLDTFRFVFRARLEPEQPARFLALRVAGGEDSSGWEKPAVRITRQQATRIVDHLAAEGQFFRRAGNVIKDAAFEPDTAVDTLWLIDDENDPQTVLVEELQYGDPRRLDALREVLEGEARAAADKLLARLESNGQQEDEGDDSPKQQNARPDSSRAPLSEEIERLRSSPSPLKLVASNVKYEGEALPKPPDDVTGEKIVDKNVAYYRSVKANGLVAEDLTANTTRAYCMFDLAIAAGWYERKGSEYLPQDIRGLYRQGSRLWMGSNGVGILVYDTKAKTWSRHSIQHRPVPGFHVTVLYGDADYVFATYGYSQEVPNAEPSLHVYSTTHGAWLRITAIPRRDALRLGTSEGLRVARGWNHRRYVEQPFVPIGGVETPELAYPRRITRRPDGSYLLHSGDPNVESSWTDLVVRPDDLQAAFERLTPLGADKTPAEPAADVTVQDALAAGLKRLADEKLPGHVFTQEKNDPNGTIRIAWKTQPYDVPRPTGKQQHAPVVVRRETGPAAEGLILTVWLSDTLGAADRPYTRNNAGIWKTYCGQASVPSLEKHLLFNVDYGPMTDEGLVDVFCSPWMWTKAAEVGDKAVSAGGDQPPPPTMEEDDR